MLKIKYSLLMKKELNKKKQPDFPDEKEIERVIKRFSDPNYRRVNQGLWPNATIEDKIKYSLCQSIVSHAIENNLTEKEVGEKLGIGQVKTEYVLFCHYRKLKFKELVSYVDNFHIPLSIKIDKQHDQAEATFRTH